MLRKIIYFVLFVSLSNSCNNTILVDDKFANSSKLFAFDIENKNFSFDFDYVNTPNLIKTNASLKYYHKYLQDSLGIYCYNGFDIFYDTFYINKMQKYILKNILSDSVVDKMNRDIYNLYKTDSLKNNFIWLGCCTFEPCMIYSNSNEIKNSDNYIKETVFYFNDSSLKKIGGENIVFLELETDTFGKHSNYKILKGMNKNIDSLVIEKAKQLSEFNRPKCKFDYFLKNKSAIKKYKLIIKFELIDFDKKHILKRVTNKRHYYII